MPAKRIGFYVELPVKTVTEIKRRATLRKDPQWMVVTDAIGGRIAVIGDEHIILTGGPRRKARGARG